MSLALSPVAPTAWLARFIEHVEVVAPVGRRPLEVERLPDGRTTLVFRVLDGGHRGDLTVAGPRTRAMFKTAIGVAHAVIVRFKPGWSALLFGVRASALTDRLVPVADLWGRQVGDLCGELLAARGVTEVVGRLSDAFARRSHDGAEPASAALARRAVRLLEGEEVRVERVAQRLGVTARHLRRAFAESIGIGPKEFARTVRLQRAVHRAETSSDWGRIAADVGYYDQAHLIGEFRELVGLTPVEFVNRRRDPIAAGAQARVARSIIAPIRHQAGAIHTAQRPRANGGGH
ncbi:MAG TPA: helix-turn-helix transcriptional regulator [Kofleriaceae bacterium]|jgi:AraC-like DNA-binding protein|nr:helix-turn-helix transcriptional regulator [Kofleriaceae bacterium]